MKAYRKGYYIRKAAELIQLLTETDFDQRDKRRIVDNIETLNDIKGELK